MRTAQVMTVKIREYTNAHAQWNREGKTFPMGRLFHKYISQHFWSVPQKPLVLTTALSVRDDAELDGNWQLLRFQGFVRTTE